MSLRFFLREAMRAMRRNAAPSFAALATVLVTMLVVGVFIPAVEVTNDAANSVRGRLIVDVYMKSNATPAAGGAGEARDPQGPARQERALRVKAAGLLPQQAKQDPAAYNLLGSNPLPDTFHVYPDNPANVLAIHNRR